MSENKEAYGEQFGYSAFVPLEGNRELLWALVKLGVELKPNFREKDCEWCGKSFVYKRLGAKFCSDACNTKSLRAKKREIGGIENLEIIELHSTYHHKSSS